LHNAIAAAAITTRFVEDAGVVACQATGAGSQSERRTGLPVQVGPITIFEETLNEPVSTTATTPGQVKRASSIACEYTGVLPQGLAGFAIEIRGVANFTGSGLQCAIAAPTEALAVGRVEQAGTIANEQTAIVAEGLAGLTIQIGVIALLAVGDFDVVVATPASAAGFIEAAAIGVACQRSAIISPRFTGLFIEVGAVAHLTGLRLNLCIAALTSGFAVVSVVLAVHRACQLATVVA